MPKRSAALLMYRRLTQRLEVFLVHPGGPFWAKKDWGAWSLPKGEYGEAEDPLEAARREFSEETGFVARGEFIELGVVKQTGGKVVSAWAVEGDCNPEELVSDRFELEWPPHSGRVMEFPEVDRGEWFSIDDAMRKILPSQRPFLESLAHRLNPD
jgi:predicted NUDIX family NTP pyrophosphohydrolase